ncbi:MAG TPA: hypothetical protein VFB71_05215 [Ramlibacter sp.]|nr:hypothetical protein [Ramlibacter sp.]
MKVNAGVVPAMLEREEYNKGLVKRGYQPPPMPAAWVNRPQPGPDEHAIYEGFLDFMAQWGGELLKNNGRIVPADIVGWFELQDWPRSEWSWLATAYHALIAEWRRPAESK